MNKKRILILLITIIIVIFVIILFTLTTKNNTESNATCTEKNFFSTSFLASYSPIDEKRYILMSSEKEYTENVHDLLTEDIKDELDFEKYDYLIYFMDDQYGCEREKILKCVKTTKRGLIMEFENQEIDKECDAIFFDAYVIRLEKDKYDDQIEIGVVK